MAGRLSAISLLAAAAFTLLDWLLPQVVELALVRAGYNYQMVAQTVLPLAFLSFPFAFFLLFYLASRVRIDLGRTYLRVAASIFFRLFGWGNANVHSVRI